MSQVSNLYVKIITNDFQPMNMPVDTVWNVNSVLGKYLVEGGYASVCNSGGTLISAPWSPTIQSASVNGTALTLTYDEDMAVTDTTGITCTVDGVARTVSLAAASTNTIVLTLASAVTAGEAVLAFYDHTTGNIVNDIGVAAFSLNNYVATNVTP